MSEVKELVKILDALAMSVDVVERQAAALGLRYEETLAGREVDRVFTLVSLGLVELAATLRQLDGGGVRL
jgi:hypothetical protein